MSAFHAPTLAIADELGFFRALDVAPASAAELAARLGIELRATEAMAGVMSTLGFVVLADGRFVLTDVARTYLLPSSIYYWGGMLRRIRENPLDCRKLIDSLRRNSASKDASLSVMWSRPQPPPEQLAAFTHAMHAHSFALAMRAMPAFAFDGVHRLLDVGGGSGSYAIAALSQTPQLRASLLDLPPVCDVALGYAEQHGVRARLELVGADMFQTAFPTGHDRILFSDIFHDWDDDDCKLLSRRAFEALPPGGKLWLHEMLLDDTKAGPATAAAYSMIMVFVTAGKQRTARELVEIAMSAGFTAPRITMTAGEYALIEVSRP
ncbi:MAG: methyltransferase [Kofleriaceae bacterium]|nr:methyltransferase [Kofleriaceae bacterium]